MSLTFTKQKEGVVGDLRYWSGTVLLDSSYPTGGEAVTAANFGFGSTIFAVSISPVGGLMFQFDQANSKFVAFYPSGGATAAPTTLADPFVTAGGTPVTSTAATGVLTPGKGKEVGNTGDLSSITLQVFALGQ